MALNNTTKVGAGLAIALLFAYSSKSKAGSNTSNLPPTNSLPPVGAYPEGHIKESLLGIGQSRGERNNNPGNIKIGNSAWLEKIPLSQNTDGTFEQFKYLAYGTRAMIKLLYNYITRHQRNTITKIIQYWDLGNPSYTTFLSNETGFPPNQILTADKPTLKKLAVAIAKFENGRYSVTDKRFEVGYNLL